MKSDNFKKEQSGEEKVDFIINWIKEIIENNKSDENNLFSNEELDMIYSIAIVNCDGLKGERKDAKEIVEAAKKEYREKISADKLKDYRIKSDKRGSVSSFSSIKGSLSNFYTFINGFDKGRNRK